jgi:hypothetical protein
MERQQNWRQVNAILGFTSTLSLKAMLDNAFTLLHVSSTMLKRGMGDFDFISALISYSVFAPQSPFDLEAI